MKSLNYAFDISLKTATNAQEQVEAGGCALDVNWGLGLTVDMSSNIIII